MCGICGKIYNDKNKPVENSIITKMMNTMVHRGPDDEGNYINGNVGLGFRRLSIIDLQMGHQPMSNEDNTVWIVFNGEIYNHVLLRDQLRKKGHIFRTNTDTECIVHLYEEYGSECVNYLNGMFAFAVWDEKKQQLLIARDRLGQKPLFYYYDHDNFLFASEIKAIIEDPCIQKEINLEAIDSYLSLRFIHTPHTMYKNILKLPPAHYLILKDGNIRMQRYWQPLFKNKISNSKDEIIEQLSDLFLNSIDIRLMSDVPIGAFLSGGIDSSIVVSLMSQISEMKPKTFSIGVADDDYNELPFAKAVADKYYTDHHEFIIKPDIVNILPKVIEMMGEPTDPFAISVYNISGVTRKHVTVALGGDGGDELFGGYDRYHGNKFVGILARVPDLLLQPIFKSLIKIIPEDFAKKSVSQKLRWLSHMSSFPENRRYFESMSFFRFTDRRKSHLYSHNLKENLNGSHPSNYILKYFSDHSADDFVDRMMYTDLMTRLPDYTLQILDHMTMAHSLEGRSPFLDYRFVELACSLPSDLKVSRGQLKLVLKELSKKYLPPQLLTREKQGFGFPLNRWLKNDLKEVINDTLNSSRLVADGYFNNKYVQNIISEHQNGVIDHQMRIWSLLNLELWYTLVFNK